MEATAWATNRCVCTCPSPRDTPGHPTDCSCLRVPPFGAIRRSEATRGELSRSTPTITSLGNFGGIVTTPVINHPEFAIVGANKIAERPVIRTGAVVPRLIMNLSSSFDHRVIDGSVAAAFVQRIRERLEHPATLFVD